jgi:hypothetical protein
MHAHGLTTTGIAQLLAEEIAPHSGTVTDTFDDGTRLFARSLLPFVEEVRPQDKLQGGVAMRATASSVRVHPYVFRQVCRNGAIMAHALETLHITDLDQRVPEDAEAEVRRGIQACCERDCFTASVESVRSTVGSRVNMELNMLSQLAHWRGQFPEAVLQQVLQQFFREDDRSQFGLMNAVTATARETRDPDLRWRLEELGGAIPALILPPSPFDETGAYAEFADEYESVAVGAR